MEDMRGIYRLNREPMLDGETEVGFGLFIRPVDAYGWVITHDHIEDGEYNQVGTAGPGTADEEMIEAVKTEGEHRIRFKMYDDDGELYYEGFFTMDDENAYHDAPYGPVEDFGMPNAGVVRIDYPDKPEWNCS